MKTNLWKLSCMAWAMAAIVTGCNQNNELGTPALSGEEDVLNVVATANDFVSSDATSRGCLKIEKLDRHTYNL